ncbi:MAG: hypothetical protein AB3N63_14670 [Puniceicoccaceae bacterium]
MSKNPVKSSRILERLQEKIPDLKVGLVPPDAFFTRKVELPEGLSKDERLAFIQLDLEGNSPFPMDQLVWGFVEDTKSDYVFVYATPKQRLRKLGFDELSSYYQLFPAFISLHGMETDKPTVRFVAQNGYISALFLTPGNPVPEKVVARKVTAELLTDDSYLAARSKLLDQLNLGGFKAEAGVWLHQKTDILPNGSVQFTHRHLSDSASEGMNVNALDLSTDSLWAADLRDSSYASQENNTRQRSKILWKALKFSVIAAILLLVFQLLIFILDGYNHVTEKTVFELEPLALQVSNKITLADRLNQSTEEDVKPFLLMESINSIRPDSVYFDKVRTNAYNILEIDGQSPEGVTPVNAFAQTVDQQPFVANVETTPRTVQTRTSFEMIITFSEMPPEPEGGFVIKEESDEETGEETSE